MRVLTRAHLESGTQQTRLPPAWCVLQVCGLGYVYSEVYTNHALQTQSTYHVFKDGSCGFVLVTLTKPALKTPVIYCSRSRFGQFPHFPAIYTYSSYTVSTSRYMDGNTPTCLGSSLWLMPGSGVWCSAYLPYLIS